MSLDNSVLTGKKPGSGKKVKVIEIKKSHEGRLHAAAGVKKGQKIPLAKEEELKAHGTPAEKKEANFAINARKWNKG